MNTYNLKVGDLIYYHGNRESRRNLAIVTKIYSEGRDSFFDICWLNPEYESWNTEDLTSRYNYELSFGNKKPYSSGWGIIL